MDSWSPSIDGEYDLQMRLKGLNGAAATLTLTVIVNDGSSDYKLAHWAEAKSAAADLTFAAQVNGVSAKSTDTISWKALSSNSNDTSITPRTLISFSHDLLGITGDTASASDLKDFADAGYDPSANEIEGVKGLQLSDITEDVLKRSTSDVDGSAAPHSLYTVVQMATESQISGSDLTVYRTNGTTTHVTKQVTSDATANPITRIQ